MKFENFLKLLINIKTKGYAQVIKEAPANLKVNTMIIAVIELLLIKF